MKILLKFCSPIFHKATNSYLFYHLDTDLFNKIFAINRCKSFICSPPSKIELATSIYSKQLQNNAFHSLPVKNIKKAQANHYQQT